MANAFVPTTRTTPTRADFARALRAVWPEATKEGAGVLWAHFAGETTDGLHCWNWNLGNVKWSRGCGFDYVSLVGVWEGFRIGDEDKDGDVDDDDRVMLVARMVATGLWKVDDSAQAADHAKAVGVGKVSLIATKANPTTFFRAYPSLEAGMRSFVTMKRDPSSRYAGAWAFVLAGDPEGYARELGRKGYYTASPDAYARAMKAKFTAWMASVSWEAAPTEPAPVASPDFAIVYAMPDPPRHVPGDPTEAPGFSNLDYDPDHDR